MAGKLSQLERKQLEKWMGSMQKSFTLLYSITRDGCNAAIFHSKCDNKGATVTVLYNTHKSVYGGYTQVSWNGNGAYMADSAAFLFRLQYNGKQALDKFPCKNGTPAVYGYSPNGPVFGSSAGHDINTFSGSIASKGTHFTLNGSHTLGTAYDMKGVPSSQVTNDTQDVTELEVYQVEDTRLLLEPWRRDCDWTAGGLKRLQNYVENYSPPRVVGVGQARVLMIGPVGAGKSSFFNSIASVFRGHVTRQACSGSAEQSITSKLRMYQVRGSASSRPLKVRLCDTRGLEENQGIDANELNFLLDGNVPDGYSFNPSMPISADTSGFIRTPTLGEKIHCVCFVIDGSTVDVLSEKLLEKIKLLQAKIHQRGVPQLLLLTKIDKVCSQVELDLSVIHSSPAIDGLVNQAASVFGMPRGHVLPVKNYESEIDLADDVSILALLSLQQMLRTADDFMFNYIDEMELQQQVDGTLNTRD